MFAVVKTGGKQYKVAENDVVIVERLEGEAGETVTLDQVLMVGDENKLEIGTPTVAGTVVSAEILEQARGDKVIVFKKKRRHHYRRKKGHRQELTVLRVTGIGAGKAPAKKAKPEAKAEAPAAEKPTKKASAKTAKAAEAPEKAPAKKAAPKKTAAKSKTEGPAKKAAPAKKAETKTAKAKAPAKKAAAKKETKE